MVRHTKPLSGGGKDKFLRGLVDSVDGVPDAARRALSKELTEGITEVRVRRDAFERLRAAPDRDALARDAAPRRDPPADSVQPKPAAPQPETAKAAPTAAPAPPFDPFAFSVVAVLTKKGKPALLAELEKVTTVPQLRQLAEAQHLAVDPDLSSESDIRLAIVSGAERRIAERKAAAS